MYGVHPPPRETPSFDSLSVSFASGWLAPSKARSRAPDRPAASFDQLREDADKHQVPCALLPPPKLASAAEQRPQAVRGLGSCPPDPEVRVPGTLVRRCSKADSEALSTADSTSTADYSSGVSSSGSTCGNFSDRTAESAQSEGQGHSHQTGRPPMWGMQGAPAQSQVLSFAFEGAGLVEASEAVSTAALAASRKRHVAEGTASLCGSDAEEQDVPGEAPRWAAREVSPVRQLRHAADPGHAEGSIEIQQPTAWHPSLSHSRHREHMDTGASRNPLPASRSHAKKSLGSCMSSRETCCSSICSDDHAVLSRASRPSGRDSSPSINDEKKNCAQPLKPDATTKRTAAKNTHAVQQCVNDRPCANSGRRATSQRLDRQRRSMEDLGSDAGVMGSRSVMGGRSCNRSCSAGPPRRRVRRGRRSTSSTASIPETISSTDAHDEHAPAATESRELAPCSNAEDPGKSRGSAAARQSQQSSGSGSAACGLEKEKTARIRNASMQLICALAEIESTEPAEEELAEIEDVFLAQTRSRHQSTEACNADSSPPTPEYLWFGRSDQPATGGEESAAIPENNSQLPALSSSDANQGHRSVSCGSDCSPKPVVPFHGFEQNDHLSEGLHGRPVCHASPPLTLADKLHLLSRHECRPDANNEAKSTGALRRRRHRQSSTLSQLPGQGMESGRCAESASSTSSVHQQCMFAAAAPAVLEMDDRGPTAAEIPSTLVGRGRGRRCRARKAARSAPPQTLAPADPWQRLAEEDAQSCEATSCVKVLRPKRSCMQQRPDAGQQMLSVHAGCIGGPADADVQLSSERSLLTECETAAWSGPVLEHAEMADREVVRSWAEELLPSKQSSRRQAPQADTQSPTMSSENEQDYWDALGQWSSVGAGSQRYACTKGQQKVHLRQGSVRQEPQRRRSTGEDQPRARKASCSAAKPAAGRRARDRDAFVVLGDPLGGRPSHESAGGPSEPPAEFWQNGP